MINLSPELSSADIHLMSNSPMSVLPEPVLRAVITFSVFVQSHSSSRDTIDEVPFCARSKISSWYLRGRSSDVVLAIGSMMVMSSKLARRYDQRGPTK